MQPARAFVGQRIGGKPRSGQGPKSLQVARRTRRQSKRITHKWNACKIAKKRELIHPTAPRRDTTRRVPRNFWRQDKLTSPTQIPGRSATPTTTLLTLVITAHASANQRRQRVRSHLPAALGASSPQRCQRRGRSAGRQGAVSCSKAVIRAAPSAPGWGRTRARQSPLFRRPDQQSSESMHDMHRFDDWLMPGRLRSQLRQKRSTGRSINYDCQLLVSPTLKAMQNHP